MYTKEEVHIALQLVKVSVAHFHLLLSSDVLRGPVSCGGAYIQGTMGDQQKTLGALNKRL